MHGWESLLNCKVCGKAFEKCVELGPEKFPVWMHDYPALEHCKALRFKQDFVKLMERKAAGMQKVWEKYNERFGEPCPTDRSAAVKERASAHMLHL